jgi:ferrous iron transport protein A
MNPARRQEAPLMPLSMVSSGARACVVEVRGGHGCERRLTALGVLPGVTLTVVRNAGAGPVVVKLKESRLALGRGMSHRIMVAQGE